jgi:hypothetical protein
VELPLTREGTKLTKTIKSADYKAVIAAGFEVLIDRASRFPAKPAIGLKIEPVDGAPFITPIDFASAKELAMMILNALMANAPELFPEICECNIPKRS